MNRLLLIVDPQNDFINGALPVPDAAAAMDALAAYVQANGGKYARIAVSCDWHPQSHCSFKENGGQWPAHCVAQSRGAAIWPRLALALKGLDPLILKKGVYENREEYSVFKNEEAAVKLCEIFASENIDSVDICGLAGDVCVLRTLRDGMAMADAPIYNVLHEYTPCLDGGVALEKFLREKEQCGK